MRQPKLFSRPRPSPTSTPKSAPPTTPNRPTGRLTEPGEVSLNWNDAARAHPYQVAFWQGGHWVILKPHDTVNGVSISFDATSAEINGLPTDHEWYFFSVQACNNSGQSDWSPYNWIRV